MADRTKNGSMKNAIAEAAADRIAQRYKGRDATRIVRFLEEQTRTEALADRLRAVIEESELSDYELSKRAGVAQSVISRFKRGEQGISLDTFEKLCLALELEVTLKKAARSRRAAK